MLFQDIDSSYLPDEASQNFIVEEQINERKKLIFRNAVEGEMAKGEGQKHKVTEAEANIELLKEQHDVLEKIKGELRKADETSGSPAK